MQYVDSTFYAANYGTAPTAFDRLLFEASRIVDNYTTGVDGIAKLKVAFPTDEDAQKAVKHCVCKLMRLINDIENAEKAIGGYQQRADGTFTSGIVSSISSGSESISFVNGNQINSALASAVADVKARNLMYRDIIIEWLSGIQDKNGVNLLYMGEYPHVR